MNRLSTLLLTGALTVLPANSVAQQSAPTKVSRVLGTTAYPPLQDLEDEYKIILKNDERAAKKIQSIQALISQITDKGFGTNIAGNNRLSPTQKSDTIKVAKALLSEMRNTIAQLSQQLQNEKAEETPVETAQKLFSPSLESGSDQSLKDASTKARLLLQSSEPEKITLEDPRGDEERTKSTEEIIAALRSYILTPSFDPIVTGKNDPTPEEYVRNLGSVPNLAFKIAPNDSVDVLRDASDSAKKMLQGMLASSSNNRKNETSSYIIGLSIAGALGLGAGLWWWRKNKKVEEISEKEPEYSEEYIGKRLLELEEIMKNYGRAMLLDESKKGEVIRNVTEYLHLAMNFPPLPEKVRELFRVIGSGIDINNTSDFDQERARGLKAEFIKVYNDDKGEDGKDKRAKDKIIFWITCVKLANK